MTMSAIGSAALTEADLSLLTELLGTPTVSPLEVSAGQPPGLLWQAQRCYAAAAAKLGFRVVHHAAAEPPEVHDEQVPLPVRQAIAANPRFLAEQPNLVLRLGRPRSASATLMCNVHLDTVAGVEPVRLDAGRIYGRGAIDAKGPAVALLAGVRGAQTADPELSRKISVIIQAVGGEEGGAMGVLGTRAMVSAGHIGRVNLFCEPTGLRYLPRATASATAAIDVAGCDAVDDQPEQGHNASVLLGHLAVHLARNLTAAGGATVCVAGLHTGDRHNRVYGSGRLLVNLAYPSREAGEGLERQLMSTVDEGLDRFCAENRDVPSLARTAAEARAVTSVSWLKRGLPALANADTDVEDWLFRRAGVPRWPADRPAFTCDAIWMADQPAAFTAVLGPGDLAGNRAHAAGEFADLAELDQFAAAVARILAAFAAEVSPGGTGQ